MKILLDENLPIKLKFRLQEFEIYTVQDMKWDSYKNGDLIKTAIQHDFTILITSDKNIAYKQNLANLGIGTVVLNVKLLKWQYIEPMLSKIRTTIPIIALGQVILID